MAQTRPAQARPLRDARDASRLNLLKAPDTPEPRKPGQGQPAPTMIIDQQQQLDTTVTVSSGTLLVGGDIIIAVDDRPVVVFDDLLDYISNRAQVGQEITLRVLRNGQERDVTVTLAARPDSN